MTELWRVSNFETLNGQGGLRYGGRWHSAGRPIVYLSESPAGALMEALVHLELQPDDLPPAYTLLRVHAPGDVRTVAIDPPPGEGWRSDLAATRELGDCWFAGGGSALARVPSLLLPHTSNQLLNPLHRDAAGLKIVEAVRAQLDSRLLRYLES